MKKQLYLMIALVSLLALTSCSENNSSSEDNNESSEISNDKPLHPDVQTDFGQIGDYQTMDEYYLDANGSKVWHGYRKNMYPNGFPKTISFYQYGDLKWTETYDELGNVLSSNK